MDSIIKAIYWFCTDFCINMANLLDITYIEFNIWLFLVLFPAVTLILIGLNLRRYVALPLIRKYRKNKTQG